MPSNNQPFCVVDIHLLENAELLDMQEDEQMMAGLQAMGAVSELRFLQSLTGKKVVLPADWRADLFMKSAVISRAGEPLPEEYAQAAKEITENPAEPMDDFFDFADQITAHFMISTIQFSRRDAEKFVTLWSLRPPESAAEVDIEFLMTCKYAALAWALNMPFKTNNILFYEVVQQADAEAYAWVELVHDTVEG